MLMINLIRKVKLLHEVQSDDTSLGFAEVWKLWRGSWEAERKVPQVWTS